VGTIQVVDLNEEGDWKGLDGVREYLVKRRAILREEETVVLGELQGEGVFVGVRALDAIVLSGEVLRVAWTRQGLHGDGADAIRVCTTLD
jgi:hypothetical protein